MRDLALILIIAGLIRLTLYRPWLGVLALAFLSYLHPQNYFDPPLAHWPVYMIMTLVVTLAAILSPQRRTPPWDWRLITLGLLWLMYLITTINSVMPWYAWPRFAELSKILLPLLLTWWLIDTREKLYYLLVTISASILGISIKGGYWAVLNNFADRVYGPPNSQYFDNNHFAILMTMNLPLLAIWIRETNARSVRIALMAGMGLTIAAIVSSWSRGALLMLAVTLMLMILNSRNKLVMTALLAGSVLFTATLVPDKWYQRMGTIVSYQQDKSANDRLEAWRAGLDYIKARPLLGGGFFAREAIKDPPFDPVASGDPVLYSKYGWHSAYVTMATEHGLPGLFVWLALLLGTMVSLTRLAARYRDREPLRWVVDYSLMLRASLIAYAIGAAFLALPYLDIWFQLVVVAMILKGIARQADGSATFGRPEATPTPLPRRSWLRNKRDRLRQ